jgi:hypothetical protein
MVAIGAGRVLRDPANVTESPRFSASTEPAGSAPDSLRSLAKGPLGRGLAGISGGLLILRGATGLDTEARGAAAAMVLGVACLFFAVVGEFPSWFRRSRRW